jgi:hypothetical protein
LGTVIVGSILLCIVALSIWSMVRDKKDGKSLQCGCNCKHCSGHCLNESGGYDYERRDRGRP